MADVLKFSPDEFRGFIGAIAEVPKDVEFLALWDAAKPRLTAGMSLDIYMRRRQFLLSREAVNG